MMSSRGPFGAASGVKVSVVVPVFNPGGALERCAGSILDQSMAPDEFEAVFVDDGSTDASPAYLDALAASHPNVRVIHQPNSGWPGKPRNVGIEAARGAYVYFVDHDDVLGREALERLYAFAERNRSDIVLGKMAGQGRGVPRTLFRDTRDRVTLEDSAIIGALTPHKLFRRAFLDRHRLRFPEGRRRLEDHVFVVQAYFKAEVISIYADYTCYYHVAPAERTASSGRYDPTGRPDAAYYYGFLREVLDIVEANTEPGQLRDRLMRRFANRELLARLDGLGFLVASNRQRRRLFDEIRSVVDRYIPGSVDATLAPHQRTQMALVRAGRLDLLVSLARAATRIGLIARIRSLRELEGGRVEIAVDSELVRGRRPLVFPGAGDRLLVPVPSQVADAVPEDVRALANPIGETYLVLRRRRDAAEISVRTPVVRRQLDASGGVRVVTALEAVIDPSSDAEGSALRSGRWDVRVRANLLGDVHDADLRQPARLGRSRSVAIEDGRLVRSPARWTLGGIGVARLASRTPRLAAAVAASRAGRALRGVHRRRRVRF